jgi:glutamate formiminotransferase/formiminotetrahydrofolate cyclodeaminase
MGKLVNMKLQAFLDELASESPAPGGGSVAALAGALGAALSSMVCSLTIGKESYEGVQIEIKAALKESELLRRQLTDLIDKDTEAFNEVMAAVKMPKETEAQKEQRRQALQKAYKDASCVPLQTARYCDHVLDVALIVAKKGNKHSITDAAAAALLAQAGVDTALLNVRINLGTLKDMEFVQKTTSEVEVLGQKTKGKTAAILHLVETSL